MNVKRLPCVKGAVAVRRLRDCLDLTFRFLQSLRLASRATSRFAKQMNTLREAKVNPHYSQTIRRARLRRSPRARGAETRICIAVTVRENSPMPHKKRKHVVRTSFRGYSILFSGSLGGARGDFFKSPLK